MFDTLATSALPAQPVFNAPLSTQLTPLDPNVQPNRKTLLQFWTQIFEIASQYPNQGNTHGSLSLVIDPTTADYARITNNAPAPQIPVHPGPNIPVDMTQITAYQNEENYKRQLQA